MQRDLYRGILSYNHDNGKLIKIETDLAYAGLNSAHVGFKRLNKPTLRAAAP